MTNKDGSTGVVSNGTFELVRQYISEPLAAQTISGTVKGQVRGRATNAPARCIAFRLCKVSTDGSTVTEIIARTTAADANISTPPSFGTGATPENRRLETSPGNTFSITVPSTSISAGEYLLLEIGSRSGSNSSPRTVTMVFGDDNGTDLPEDETTTAANNPWVEFTYTITFAGGGSYDLTAQSGDIPITGTSATLRYGRVLQAQSGNVGVTGTSATLLRGRVIQAQTATVAVTGTSATLRRGRVLQAQTADIPITGTSATLRCGRVLQAQTANVVITGTNADLQYNETEKILSALSGNIAITGTNATLRRGYALQAQSGNVAVGAPNASLTKQWKLQAQIANVPIGGVNANLIRGRVLQAQSANVQVTGTDVNFRRAYVLMALSSNIQITGQDAALEYLGAGNPALLNFEQMFGAGGAAQFSGGNSYGIE